MYNRRSMIIGPLKKNDRATIPAAPGEVLRHPA